MKQKSEKHILQRLAEEVKALKKRVGSLYGLECAKSDINREIADGIKKEGDKFKNKLEAMKKKVLQKIRHQTQTIYILRKIIIRIRHLLTLLVNLEQSSLVIHNDLKRDELSELIDSENMPLSKFKVELDHVDTLKTNLDILIVELAKQEEYIKNYSLQSANMDENEFYQSQRYVSKISTSTSGSVWELKNFSNSMEQLIRNNLKNKKQTITESDRVASSLMEELKNIKLKSGLIFSYSIYDFVNRVVNENVNSKNLRKLVSFLIFFLLSRLKKFHPESYYSQIRSTIMIYHVLEKSNLNEKRKNIIVAACLLRRIDSLNLPKVENETGFKEELNIVRKYYKTVSMFLDHEFPFINKVLVVLQKKKGEYETPLEWVEDGAKLIKVVYEVDKKIQHHKFDREDIEKNRENLFKSVERSHKKHKDDIDFLLKNWNGLIPKKLRKTM